MEQLNRILEIGCGSCLGIVLAAIVLGALAAVFGVAAVQ